MTQLCIAIVGSRRIDRSAFQSLAQLAEYFCESGHTVVSGGTKQGAELAAEVGASRVRDGQNLVLYLSPQFHRNQYYPEQCQRYFIPVGPGAHHTPSWQLAWDHALPEQRGMYWELFWRNAYIAMSAHIILEWRIDEESRSTEHLLRCADARGKPVVNCQAEWKRQPWTSTEALIRRADSWLSMVTDV